MKTILFQGDSITDCQRIRESAPNMPAHLGYGYPNLISAQLLYDHAEDMYRCINKGVSGNRVVDLYARWKIDALNFSPDLISILIGVNDVWHEANKNGVESDRFEQVYRMLLEWTKKVLPEVKLIIMEPFALPSDVVTDEFLPEVKIRAAIAKKIAEEFDAVFLPLQEKLDAAAKRNGNNSYWLWDGVHPTPAGHRLIADAWLEAAKPLLKD